MPRFDAQAWARLNDLLDRALDLPTVDREIWLLELAVREPADADAVRSLLVRRDQLNAERFLESPVSPITRLEVLRAPLAGRQIGAYTLEGMIGRGGMGEVWLASRSDGQFEGQCAIKLLNDDAAPGRLADRVRDEARLLARLGHPNIARLLDAGVTPEGTQFLVLEYVDGQRIDHYCTTKALTVRERVRLFTDVVAAVAHAHTHLIVHRDLKPSNVLVTKEGVVKLLDFGVAKLLRRDTSPSANSITRIEDAALTPEYAAPEQLMGDVPSTATDVYQLGMLLYVLLIGRHPLHVSSTRRERIETALAGAIPRASRLADRERRHELRGDLDAILETALETAPTQRYPTAAALREELLRYLNGEPVSARKGAAFYRTRKFISRYRFGVAASAAAMLALCIAVFVAFQQAGSARSERDRALAFATRNAAVTDFLGILITEASEAGAPVTVNDMLGRSERLALADSSGVPENRAAVLEMIAARYASLGDDAKAARLLESAQALVANSPDDSLKSKLACTFALTIASLGHAKQAITSIERELERMKTDPQNAAYCLLDRALIADNDNDAEGALRYAQEALKRFRKAPRTTADEGSFLGAVAFGYHMNQRNLEAEDYYRQALRKYIELGRDGSPDAIALRNNWAVMYEDAAVPLKSITLLDEALRIVTERNPNSPPPAYLIGNRARALERVGRYAEGEADYVRALDLARAQHIAQGDTYCLLGLAATSLEMRRLDATVDYLRQVEATLSPHELDQSPPWMSRAMTISHVPPRPLITLIQGRLSIASGNPSAVRSIFVQLLDERDGKPDNRVAMSALGTLAELSLASGDAAQAAAEARRMLQISIETQGGLPYSLTSGQAWLLLGLAARQQGDEHQARAAFNTAVLHLSQSVGESSPLLIQARGLNGSQNPESPERHIQP